jgi:uncharacterized protein YukE
MSDGADGPNVNAAASTKRVSRGQLLDVAYELAWRFEAYDSYSRRPATAIRALRRRCPGHSDRQYENAFARARQLYQHVCDLVRDHSDDVWRRHHARQDVADMFDAVLRPRFSGFRLATFHQAVGMTFYYWHLR